MAQALQMLFAIIWRLLMYSLYMRENSELEIPEELTISIKEMLHDDPSLPIKLSDNILSFA